MSHHHITSFRDGFSDGYTKIIGMDDVAYGTGMEFGILKLLGQGATLRNVESEIETQLIILNGRGKIQVDSTVFEVSRQSLFTETPWAFDISRGVQYKITASDEEPLEIAVIKTVNLNTFEPIVLRPEEIPNEQRGEGLASGTMHRIVRAIFGDPNALEHAKPKESNLVVGEVVNFPGRWSSYPPHFHPHAEVYYYRFSRPSGFGVSLIDDPAPVVRTHDVVKILNCTGHAQVSAPGYAMWYLWFIRQIEGNRYEGNPPFKYLPEHTWVLNPEAKIMTPE